MTTSPQSHAMTPKQEFLATNLRDGESYAGILLGQNGEPDAHIILLPGDADPLTWPKAKEWAKKQGGELPTRREQALLFANLKGEFKPNWYWSSQQHETNDQYAWVQGFDGGGQYRDRKDSYGRARAVRRLVIE